MILTKYARPTTYYKGGMDCDHDRKEWEDLPMTTIVPRAINKMELDCD